MPPKRKKMMNLSIRLNSLLRHTEPKPKKTLVKQNVSIDKNEIVLFKNVKIPQYEVEILQELEKKLKKVFKVVKEVEWHTQMGFTIDKEQ